MLLKWGLVLFLWNSFVFALYAFDKQKAIKGQWRISEKTLLLTTLFCGGLGAWLAAKSCHHKTRKWYFVLTWYLGMLLTLLFTYAILKVLN
ncbi:UNVERIFIED_CONTAM: DUF1294 domain-containing protein [Streptococcus canis]|uniref:DUF1294 domain-containing protein n=1 Tax=Streptococcus canis TaxID=1329 RepID=UPI000B8B2597|nr:DUF1294 domain-containing protein [Streptococcus canis]MDW7799462.1 DUF1294 domain-containing protein [Streptococcus canis]QJD12632.1 DUF1294 domain-containing protein [Streptococcus canis]GFG46894.1 hypothetical protein ScFU97_02330 [Streptococcus canis]VTR80269.1 membrane protein [Streptococcus canis]